MAITYDWIVDQMNTYPDHQGCKDVVFNIIWRCSATDGQHHVLSHGTSHVKFNSPSDFTPYSELTNDKVIGWVKDVLGEEEVSKIELELADQIDKLVNPPIVTLPNPWDIR